MQSDGTSMGGQHSCGGSGGSGGSTSTGGTTETGGAKSTGGTTSSGGTVASGGRSGSGGATRSDGGASAGGSSATGGSTASGGRTTGTRATGGSTARAGAGGSGGVTTTGGSTGRGGIGGTGAACAFGGSTGKGGASGTGGSTGATFHVFLLIGQSNMAGYPKAVDADKVKNERIRVLGFDDCSATRRKADQWDVSVPPLHECWNGALGPGDYFVKTLIDKLPANDTIGLVPCALSGQAIEIFWKGTDKYTWIINRAKAAQKLGGVIEGRLFHQGESNCGDSAWPGKVQKLVSDLRTDLGLGDVPFLAGELVYSGNCSQHNQQVAKLPGHITNGYVVSASGLNLDPADTQWHLHFDHAAQVERGKRYEAKLVEALSW